MARAKQRVDENVGQLGAGGGGAADATSGSGAGAGIPYAETVMRAGEVVTRGDVKKDRKRIFGDAPGGASAKKKKRRA